MLIKNYKRINYFNFNLTDTKFILNKDYFERQDLIEAFKILFANKKTNLESIIKWTEFDTIYNLKITRLILVPSIIDFQKDFLNGTKSLFKNLINEIITILGSQNSNLIEMQNLLFNFKLENELIIFGDLLKNLNQNLGWDLETNFSGSINQIISDYYSLDISNQEEKITENNISLMKLKQLYFNFLDCFQKCSNDNLILIFDDPLNGLNYEESMKILELINNFKNKIVVANWLPELKNEDLVNLCLWNKDWFCDFSNIFDDLTKYQKYIDTPIEQIIESTLKVIHKSFNTYDQRHQKYLKFNEKDKEVLWKAIINQF